MADGEQPLAIRQLLKFAPVKKTCVGAERALSPLLVARGRRDTPRRERRHLTVFRRAQFLNMSAKVLFPKRRNIMPRKIRAGKHSPPPRKYTRSEIALYIIGVLVVISMVCSMVATGFN
jgi:hypothetical protein